MIPDVGDPGCGWPKWKSGFICVCGGDVFDNRLSHAKLTALHILVVSPRTSRPSMGALQRLNAAELMTLLSSMSEVSTVGPSPVWRVVT